MQLPEHDTSPSEQDRLPVVLGFLWDFLGDWKRLIGFAFAILTVALAALLIMVGPAWLIYYIAAQHVPVAAKIAIPSGSVAITLGGALLGAARARRRGGRDR